MLSDTSCMAIPLVWYVHLNIFMLWLSLISAVSVMYAVLCTGNTLQPVRSYNSARFKARKDVTSSDK